MEESVTLVRIMSFHIDNAEFIHHLKIGCFMRPEIKIKN